MSHKTLFQISIVVTLLAALLMVPLSANAGGYCGSTYTAQSGDTLGSVSSICGVTVSDLYNANPNTSYFLSAGQVLTIPIGTNTYKNTNGYYNYNGYNGAPYNYNYAPNNIGQTYVVQVGDTLSGIASRFGVGLNALWYANPTLVNTGLYAGQVLNIPSASLTAPTPVPPPWYGTQQQAPWYGTQQQPPWYGSQQPAPWSGYGQYPYRRWYGYVPTPTPVPVPLSAGKVPSNAPTANIELVNRANGQVYVSLQGTARNGTNIIREYPVSGTIDKTIPAGYYNYVAWVGGREFSGAINLPGGSSHTLIFHSNAVDAK